MEPSLTGLARNEDSQLSWQMDEHMPARSICLEFTGHTTSNPNPAGS